MDYSSFYKSLYFKTLTPFELLEFSKKHKCTFKVNENTSYLDTWKTNIFKNESDDIFQDYLVANDIKETDTILMTSSIKDCEGEIDYPLWINILGEILNQVNIEEKFTKKENRRPFYCLFFPFIKTFSVKFKQHLLDSNIKLPNKDIIDQLQSVLYKDLFSIAHLVLFDEFSKFKKEESSLVEVNEDFYFKKFTSGILSDKFHNLFLEFPMLARKLAIKTHNYLEFTTTLFERFESDKSEIEYLFDVKFAKISKLHLNSGDLHNGATTVILEFKNSYKIVYKPTNIAITFAYNQFLDWVNAQLGSELRSFNVIDKENYGWLEFVANSECKDIEDVKLYYERAGILIGIGYFLNARDYHYDNLIASGNCPILIDHETIIGPNINLNNNKGIVVGSVLETHLLPSLDKESPSYMCGFGSSVQMKTDVFVTKIKNSNKDNMGRVLEKISRNLYKSNKPRLNNKIKNLIDFQSEFRKGFQQIYKLVLDNKQNLLSKDSPLKEFKDSTVRFIYRPTEVYLKFLTLLNRPEYLRDAITYGIKIELLARAYAIKNIWSPVLGSEREQMLLGDIPVFYTKAMSSNLVLSDGQVADKFELNALEVIYVKIENANIQDYNNQVDLIQEVITL